MKKLFFILSLSFIFFIFPSFGVSAAVPNTVPTLPPTPEGYQKHLVFYCDGLCLGAYNNNFTVIYYKDFSNISTGSGGKKTVTFVSPIAYIYDGSTWIKQSLGGDAFAFKPNTIPIVKCNDSQLKEALGKDFFLKQPVVLPAVEGVEMGAVLKVVKEIAPIVVLSIVSFLGLRKAWRFCLSQLKSS